MKIRNRKSLYLHSTILRGQRCRDTGEDGGDVEVGPGFAAAAAKMSGEPPADDKGQQQEEGNKDDAQGDPESGTSGGEDGSEGDGDGAGGEDGDGAGEEGGEGAGGEEGKGKRNTAEYIRELKRERRELRQELALARQASQTFEQRLAALERGGLPKGQEGANDSPTSAEKPDAEDAKKYPLGVLDDKYIHDMIEWAADKKVAAALDGRLRTEREQAEEAQERERLKALKSKVDDLAETGSKLFDDYEETVLEAGLRGDFPLTETTFTAAAKRTHGAEILYELANNPKEARRIANLPLDEQVAYVVEKNSEIAAKRKPNHKPNAGDPPSSPAKGRNASNPIRPDTENLDDFRKLWYKPA